MNILTVKPIFPFESLTKMRALFKCILLQEIFLILSQTLNNKRLIEFSGL